MQRSRVGPGSSYSRAVRSVGAAIDTRLAGLIITRLRRLWPLLKLVPAPWLVPIVAPAARGLRRSLYRDAVTVVVVTCVVIVAAALVS